MQKNRRSTKQCLVQKRKKYFKFKFCCCWLSFGVNYFIQVDGQKIMDRHMSEDVKERLDSSTLSPPSEDALVNLEFTLGRPSWQMDCTESSHELALLKCWSINQSNRFTCFNYEEMDEWIILACCISCGPCTCLVISLKFCLDWWGEKKGWHD